MFLINVRFDTIQELFVISCTMFSDLTSKDLTVRIRMGIVGSKNLISA